MLELHMDARICSETMVDAGNLHILGTTFYGVGLPFDKLTVCELENHHV
jgi:hypothetical protein